MGLAAEVFDDGLAHRLIGRPQGGENPERQRRQHSHDDDHGIGLDGEGLAFIPHGETLPAQKRSRHADARHTTG